MEPKEEELEDPKDEEELEKPDEPEAPDEPEDPKEDDEEPNALPAAPVAPVVVVPVVVPVFAPVGVIPPAIGAGCPNNPMAGTLCSPLWMMRQSSFPVIGSRYLFRRKR